MGSKVVAPYKCDGMKKGQRYLAYPSETVTRKLPAGTGWNFEAIHDGYYKCEEAILMLVRPQSELPAKKEKAGPKPEQMEEIAKAVSKATA
jgi:hypothetical protein